MTDDLAALRQPAELAADSNWHNGYNSALDDVAALSRPPAPSLDVERPPDERLLALAMRYGYAWIGVPEPDQWPRVARMVAAEYDRLIKAGVAEYARLSAEEPQPSKRAGHPSWCALPDRHPGGCEAAAEEPQP